jgi:isoleucyl-tRNA synthetase
MVAGEIPGAYAGQETGGVWVIVEPAGGEKCQRCWIYDGSVGQITDHPTICSRCSDALAQMKDVDTVS